MDSSSSSSAAVHPAAASISSLHRLLALECSFTFLSLADLSRIVRVCVEWRSLVQSMPSLAVTSVYPRLFQPLCASPLARHISRFDELSMKGKPRGSHAQTLSMIVDRMTALQSLRWELQRDAMWTTRPRPLRLPAALRELDLLLSSTAAAAESAIAMVAIASLRHLERLTLSGLNVFVSFAPLRSCASLRHLNLATLPDALCAEQIGGLRSLTQLEGITLRLTEAGWVQLLAGANPPAHLRSIAHLSFKSAVCAALCDLPSLTSLTGSLLADSSLNFVSRLPLLCRLELHCGAFPSAGSLLISALESSSLPSALTDLNLECPTAMDSACLSRLLRFIPRLQRLRLHFLPALMDLSWIGENPSLSQTLTHLTLSQCFCIHTNERSAIESLTALQSLALRLSFRDSLFPSELARYAVGGIGRNFIWPHLREFIYDAPRP